MKIAYLPAVIIVFLLQAAIVGWAIVDREQALRSERVVRLAVEPVDPRDPLRGEYVVLSYEVSQLSTAALAGDAGFATGDPISVSLRQDQDRWSAEAVHRARRAETEFPLAGIVRSVRLPATSCEGDCGPILQVAYGIESFFVPEGAGRELERLRNSQRLAVDVALDEHGRAMVTHLLVDDAVRYSVSLFE